MPGGFFSRFEKLGRKSTNPLPERPQSMGPARPVRDAIHPQFETDHSWSGSAPKPPSSVEPPRVYEYTLRESPVPPRQTPQSDYLQSDFLETIAEGSGSLQTAIPPPLGPSVPLTEQNLAGYQVKRRDGFKKSLIAGSTPAPPSTSVQTPSNTTSDVQSHNAEHSAKKIGESPTIPPFLSRYDVLKPKPPDEVISEVEATRKGKEAAIAGVSEAAYQVDMTPPVRRRTPPPQIRIDMTDIQSSLKDIDPVTNTSTWVSSTARLAPPVANIAMNTPSEERSYDIAKPTCSLNLVCYRSGAKGCVLRQVHTVLESRFKDSTRFEKAIAANPQLIHTDEQFFLELRRLYWIDMCGFWRRYFFLKTLQGLRVLAYSPVTRPTVVPLDDFVLQEMMYAYRHPTSITTEHEWINWVFRLRRHDKRHALEFVESWNSTRIVIAGTLPWLTSCLIGIIWSASGGDIQTAFTVAGFVLTSSTVILALLAIISGIESSGRASM